ncbi:MAG: helix-turn-helix transcriptional regulator [Paracoccaceae bacterium]
MRKSTRLFEIIQILRAAAGPVRADDMAEALEVSVRTIYRDIAALQAMRTPIEGEAGIGYVMRKGYDLPPLNFDEEEVEALRVALCMLARSGDTSLMKAADRVREKVDALHGPADWLQVAPHGAPLDNPQAGCVAVASLRRAILEERKLQLVYRDEEEVETTRIVRPVAVIYHLHCNLLAAWCELRAGFRHFRLDRIYDCTETGERFEGQGAVLREIWAPENAY